MFIENIRCITLKGDKVLTGIKASNFDCVVSQSDEDLVTAASIKAFPLLDDASAYIGNSQSVEFLLCFVTEKTDAKRISNCGLIISVSPSEWRPCRSAASITLLDPCGHDGNLLLYIHRNVRDVLVSVKNRNKTVSQQMRNGIAIGRRSRGKMLFDALTIPVTPAELPKSSLEILPVSPTKLLDSSVNDREEELQEEDLD